ncbi:MAG TPA: M23 family metallopeptidase [Patescibacteria group bacterium]|nr:M23 family metallopeptidase [Patescibacteria group bacterium]
MVTITQPSHIQQQRFVEQPVSYHLDSAGPDPELKKLLPLLFATLPDSADTDQTDAQVFASLFVDKTPTMTADSADSEKTMPIATSDLKGISTFFSGWHPGIDLRADVGTPIHAILPGTVNEVSFERGGYGNYAILVHHVDGKTLFSLYAHMKSVRVQVGDTVAAGDEVGIVGVTGHSTGPHLHFEMHTPTMAIDPIKFLRATPDAIALVTK